MHPSFATIIRIFAYNSQAPFAILKERADLHIRQRHLTPCSQWILSINSFANSGLHSRIAPLAAFSKPR